MHGSQKDRQDPHLGQYQWERRCGKLIRDQGGGGGGGGGSDIEMGDSSGKKVREMIDRRNRRNMNMR